MVRSPPTNYTSKLKTMFKHYLTILCQTTQSTFALSMQGFRGANFNSKRLVVFHHSTKLRGNPKFFSTLTPLVLIYKHVMQGVFGQLGVPTENEGEKFIDVFLYEIIFKN